MALSSPGVQVSVTTEAFYTGAAPGTVPLVVLATKQDKTTPDGSAIASGTTSANAGQLYLISSQRELLQTFGNPDFNEVGGSSQNGYPLNEYGLLAAYSYLGLANRAYVIRPDLDLAELDPTSVAPTSDPLNDTYWVDLNNFVAGMFEWNGTAWVQKTVTVYENSTDAVIDGSSSPSSGFVTGDVIASFGVSSTNEPSLQYFRKDTTGVWRLLGGGSATVDFQWAPHTSVPSTESDNSTALAVNDLWLKTTTPNNGLSIDVKKFDSSLEQFVDLGSVPIYDTHATYYAAHSASSVAAGTVIGLVDSSDSAPVPAVTPPKPQSGALADVQLQVHNGNSTTVLTGTTTGFTLSNAAPTMTIDGTAVSFTTGDDVNAMVVAINSNATLTAAGVVASANSGGYLVITDTTGADIVITAAAASAVSTDAGVAEGTYSNFTNLDQAYTTYQSVAEPTTAPAYGTYWYDPSFLVDILSNDGAGNWTDFSDDIFVQSDDPTTTAATQATVTAGDLWVKTDEVDSYPVIYRRNSGNTAWTLIDNTDHTTPDGIIFADARVNPSQASTDLDLDAPDALLYPGGLLLWNTRYSGRNVKQWTQDATALTSAPTTKVDRWVSVSGLKEDGTPYMGVYAQRNVVVEALASVITSNEDIRNDTIFFNLIACPGYTELLSQMVSLNIDRKEQAFVVGDAPFHLSSDTTSLQNWASNANNATSDGDTGLVTADPNLAVYYPAGLTTNVDGSEVVVPPSHMVLRVMAYNDQVAYPWYAPAGYARGVVSNASSVGYLDSSDDYIAVQLTDGQRTALFTNNVNPIAEFPNSGLVVYGQKTRDSVAEAQSNVNVSRLVNYIRYHADLLGKPFLWEQNDTITRAAVKNAYDSFLANLVTLRGLYDFSVVCDTSNNTSARIARNELWVDIMIQPVEAVDYIYIPIRLQNPGTSA